MLLGLLLMLSLGDPIFVQTAGITEGEPSSARDFAYDAADARGRRKSPAVRTADEDALLDPSKRSKIQANANDICRNFAVAAWMVRKHLDYVASFQFHCRSGDMGLDTAVEQFVSNWSRPYNFDIAGRHRRSKFMRLAEARRTIDGDVGVMKLRDGRLQGIESDRVRDPKGMPALQRNTRWVHGVRVDTAGAAQGYAVHRRKGQGGFEFERTVPAQSMCMLGYYERFDQVRGISPITAALNPLRDVYENFDFALAKAKITQLFAMAIYNDSIEGLGEHEQVDGDKYEVDFGRGPIKIELDPGDRAEFLESKNPSTEFQNFTQLVLMVALKALDLPYSFYDEKHTNFFGSRAAWLHYERACVTKREDLEELHIRLTLWRLMLAILEGDLVLPSGKTLADVPFEWVPTGMPWWDPAKEIRGDLMAIGAGLDNPQRICKERGRGDWYDNIDRIAEAKAYAEKRGVDLSFVPDAGPLEVETNAE